MKKSIIAMCLAVASFGASARELDFMKNFYDGMALTEVERVIGYQMQKIPEVQGYQYRTGFIKRKNYEFYCTASFKTRNTQLHFVACGVTGDKQFIKNQFEHYEYTFAKWKSYKLPLVSNDYHPSAKSYSVTFFPEGGDLSSIEIRTAFVNYQSSEIDQFHQFHIIIRYNDK